jgi:membrane protein YqaA with SNARE-associated domain
LLQHFTDALRAFGPLGVFLLALLDGAGVPLPAVLDIMLILVVVKSPEHAWLTAGMATVGSLIGNVGLFQAARTGGRRWIKVPAPDKPQKFRQWFQRFGLVTVFIPAVVPFIPLPLKVFVVSAGVLHTGLAQFLAVMLLARVTRYFGEAYLGMKMGEEGAKAFLKGNMWTMAGVLLAFALVLYGVVRLYDRRRQTA